MRSWRGAAGWGRSASLVVSMVGARLWAAETPPVGGHDDFLVLMWGSGWVVRLVLLTLIGFSIGCWGIALAKSADMRRARRQSDRFEDIFWGEKKLSVIQSASVDMKDSPVAQIFRAGYEELQRLTRSGPRDANEDDEVELSGIENLQRAIHRARTQEITRLERGLTFLATTSSTAPFIGLFGTVWGIMTAFRGLSTATSSSIQAVAPGIAEALIATAVGLAAAIPAVIMYNRFARQLRVLTARMDGFASEFLNIAERHFLSKKK